MSESITGDGNTLIPSTGDYPGVWRSGRGTFTANGTWDGSETIKLQFSDDQGTTWHDVGSLVTFSSNGAANFELPSCKIRVNAASTGGNTDVKVRVTRIRD
jgi:hypothetical protein